MNFVVGQTVWARRQKDHIYWPGKISLISNNANDFWSPVLTDNIQQQYIYCIEFFVTSQSIWTTDILPYQQYRYCMASDSFIQYGLHSTIKQDFLNAISQADYHSTHDMYIHSHYSPSIVATTSQQQQHRLAVVEDNTDNNFLLTSTPMLTSNTELCNSSNPQSSTMSLTYTSQAFNPMSTNSHNTNQMLTTNTDWYKEQGLLVESITPPLRSESDHQIEHISSLDNSSKQNNIVIITSKTYSNSSFISYIFNCLVNNFHSSIIYIDDLIDYQQPTTSNTFYLICLDYFDSIIQQTLNLTIVNNLNSHTNHFFLIINPPSYDFIKYFHSIIMDKQTILIVHYHSSFDNEPLLLCSGNRTTYEIVRSLLLKYLCSKIKYIESNENEHEQLYGAYYISSIIQSTNILNHFINENIHETLNEKFSHDFLRNNQTLINDLFPPLSTNILLNDNHLSESIHNYNEELLMNKSKQSIIINDLFQSHSIRTHILPPICEYYAENVLHEK